MSIINPLPYNIVNGTPIDAVPVMADFNWIVSQVNTNVAATVPTNASSIPTYVPAGSVGGTANAITLTPTPSIGAYAAGQRYSFVAGAANTGAVTIATSGLATRTLKYEDGTAMGGGELLAGGTYDIIDNGTNYVLLNSSQGTGLLAFTPTLLFGGAAVGMTLSVQTGQYMKVGRIVYYYISLAMTAKGSSTGAVTLGGLPYPILAGLTSNFYPAMVPHLFHCTWTGAYPIALLLPGTSTVELFGVQNSTIAAQVTMSELDMVNTSAVRLSGWYFT